MILCGIGILPVMLAQHRVMPSSLTTSYNRLEAYPTTGPPKTERYCD